MPEPVLRCRKQSESPPQRAWLVPESQELGRGRYWGEGGDAEQHLESGQRSSSYPKAKAFSKGVRLRSTGASDQGCDPNNSRRAIDTVVYANGPLWSSSVHNLPAVQGGPEWVRHFHWRVRHFHWRLTEQYTFPSVVPGTLVSFSLDLSSWEEGSKRRKSPCLEVEL